MFVLRLLLPFRLSRHEHRDGRALHHDRCDRDAELDIFLCGVIELLLTCAIVCYT